MNSSAQTAPFNPRVMERITDPLAVVFAFLYLMLTKYTAFELTQDELLWGFMAMASVRAAVINWYASRGQLEKTSAKTKEDPPAQG